MDADFKEKRSAKIGGKRWSMNSQRLEEIVAELMRPIGDRQSFDTDQSALLEEYLTEAGLHALDADSDDEGSGSGPIVAPNFAELALLLQHSASIYGRKVDCLYQHVLSVSESLHNSTIEITNTSTDNPEEPQTPSTSRRKRKYSGCGDFAPIELERCPAARREPGAARPPPTLPRMYIELEPRVMGEGDAPLYDYAGEPIGLLSDFHVAWRLQNGLLVEELDGYTERAALRPIPLMELQAAIEANAPPSPPPLLREDTPPRDAEPVGASTPCPPAVDGTDGDMPPPPPPPPAKRERKRKAEVSLEEMAGVKLLMTKELRIALRRVSEFDGAAEWVERVVLERSRTLLLTRRRLRTLRVTEFRGFEYCSQDTSGFAGWTSAEAETAAELMRTTLRSTRLPEDSDDDGFFEQSSLGDSDHSRADDYTHSPLTAAERSRLERSSAEAAEWAAWRARVAARAQHEHRAPLDVKAVCKTVLGHLPATGEPKHFDNVLREAATDDSDVSRLFLATLFLANSGNVTVVQGAPLALNSFSLQLVSTDERLYSAAASEDPVTVAALSNPHNTHNPHTPHTSHTPHTPHTSQNSQTSQTPHTSHTPQNSETPHKPHTSQTPHTPDTSQTPHTPNTSHTPHTPHTTHTPHKPHTPRTYRRKR